MSTRYSGLAMRSFIIGSRLWPPATSIAPSPRPVEQADGVVDARGAFVLERSRNLHVHECSPALSGAVNERLSDCLSQ